MSQCSHPAIQFEHSFLKMVELISSVGGIAVSIAAFQADDPGSTPGHRNPVVLK